MMKAISVAEFGGPDVMKVAEIARPEPKEGEVLIKVFAAGVNPVDTYKRAGTYAKHLLPALPFTPGADGAGIVEALGAGVDSVAVGDRIWLSGSTTGSVFRRLPSSLFMGLEKHFLTCLVDITGQHLELNSPPLLVLFRRNVR